MKKFGLGFASVSSNDLIQYLHSKGYADDLILEAGVASFDEKSGLHDKFWNRVMFPIQDRLRNSSAPRFFINSSGSL